MKTTVYSKTVDGNELTITIVRDPNAGSLQTGATGQKSVNGKSGKIQAFQFNGDAIYYENLLEARGWILNQNIPKRKEVHPL